MKIYVFDIDGNLLSIPTKFYMINIKTKKIEIYKAGESGHILDNKERLGLDFYVNETYSMRNFRGITGDIILKKDIKYAVTGPSWSDFVECVNGGSFFCVITSRGNSQKCLKDIFRHMIMENENGLSMKPFVEHIKRNKIFLKRENIKDLSDISEEDILDRYINNYCSFYARYSKETIKLLKLTRKTKIKDAKLIALKDFEIKVKNIIGTCVLDEIIDIGFSDDEESNCLEIWNYLKDSSYFRSRVYSTSSGSKVIYTI